MVLRYICILVCCYKKLDAYTYTACRGIFINIETLLKYFFEYFFIIYFSLNLFSHSVHIVAYFS